MAIRETATCEVCGGFTRLDYTMCSPCMVIATGPQPCACGHDAREHFETHCNHSYWSQVMQSQVPCQCDGFEAAA